MPRPKQRTPELRDHVLTAAIELLARDGVAGFTARSVAREAQTSTPAPALPIPTTQHARTETAAGASHSLFIAVINPLLRRLMGQRWE